MAYVYEKYLAEELEIRKLINRIMNYQNEFYQEFRFEEDTIEMECRRCIYQIKVKDNGCDVYVFYEENGNKIKKHLDSFTENKLAPCFDVIYENIIYENEHPFSLEIRKYLNGTCREFGMQCHYDREEQIFYFCTKLAFWRIRYSRKKDFYYLEHSPFQYMPLAFPEGVRKAYYHSQGDAGNKKNPGGFLTYVYNHDRAKLISNGDVKKLPESTKRERKYKRQAINRERKKQTKRVYELLEELSSQKEANLR